MFQLWEDADIIILGERDHRDTTQYNLILDILSDKRFIENVGYLYIEIGVVNATKQANELIQGEFDKKEFDKKFAELQLIEGWEPVFWDLYNHYQLLYGLYKINKNLPKNKKISLGLLDMEFTWNDEMTVEKYRHFIKVDMNKEFATREKIMADNFLKFYPKQKVKNNHKKALVITSREYAGKYDVQCRGNRVKRQASFIKDIYGDKVKTVAMNWYKWMPLNWQTQILPNKTNGLSANGKFDAAFELTNCNPMGFNLADSPFGDDEYDYPYDNNLKWQDVFDGFIFHEPYYNIIGKAGFPTKITTKQSKEYIKRIIIYDKAYNDKKEARLLKWFGWIYKYILKKEYRNERTFPCYEIYENHKEWKSEMNRWMENK